MSCARRLHAWPFPALDPLRPPGRRPPPRWQSRPILRRSASSTRACASPRWRRKQWSIEA